MDDPEINTILSGLTVEARKALIGVLGEALNTWQNLDAVCHKGNAACKEVASMSRLERLFDRLNRPV